MIYIVCALHCEAKPLIEYYKLKLDREALYPVFSNDEISLVVSGIGKLEMASAISYLFAHFGEQRNSAWLNIGIAGHGFHPVGSLLNINKISDGLTAKCWYPGRLPQAPGIGCELLSVDKPEQSYPLVAAVDMEASAFMVIVQRYTLVDLLQILKVVSDNSQQDIESIDKTLVSELVTAQMPAINETITLLQDKHEKYAKAYESKKSAEEFFSHWRFSEYQRKELEKLLEKAQALQHDIDRKDYLGCEKSQQVLQELKQNLDKVKIEF